jgi:hypothetical protein
MSRECCDLTSKSHSQPKPFLTIQIYLSYKKIITSFPKLPTIRKPHTPRSRKNRKGAFYLLYKTFR